MPAPRKLPDNTTLRTLRAQGWKLADIADKYGVTEGAVWKALERAGFTEQQATYQDIVPWEIHPRHRSTAIAQRFRSLMRIKRGIPLNPTEQHLLDTWLKVMKENDVVLDYHPDAPANDASRLGGFFYTPRLPEDGTGIVRMPKKKAEEPAAQMAPIPDPMLAPTTMQLRQVGIPAVPEDASSLLMAANLN